jgi:hypothetical protein
MPQQSQAAADPVVRIRVPVDAHVHLHEVSLVSAALQSAQQNFSAQGRQGQDLLGAILLAQMSHELVFEQLLNARNLGGWAFEPVAAEPMSLIARRDATSIAIICGRQIRAEDGLEVLALGTMQSFIDGHSFAASVDAVLQSGAVTVLPWGFGKWAGDRGERVRSVARAHGPQAIYLGDSGGRLASAGVPQLIRDLQPTGFRVLPGTDPLVVRHDYRRIGRFGFLLDMELHAESPWQSLKSWISRLGTSPAPYGRACSMLEFFQNQLALRLQRPADST